CFAGKPVKHGEVFRAVENIAGRIAVIRLSVTDNITSSIDSAICGFNSNFCTAITIKVVGYKLRVVRTGTDIFTQINSPELLTFQRISIYVNVAGVATLRIVFSIARVPFDNNFVLPITI